MKLFLGYPVNFPFKNMAVRNRIIFLSGAYDMTFLTRDGVQIPDELPANGTDITSFPRGSDNDHVSRIKFFFSCVKRLRSCRKNQFDMAYSFSEDTSLIAGYAAKALKKSRCWAVDFLDDPGLEIKNWKRRKFSLYKVAMVSILSFLEFVMKMVLRKADIVVVQGVVEGDQLPQILKNKYKVPFEKMVMVTNGVNLEMIDPSTVERLPDAGEDAPFRIFYIGYVSRLRGVGVLLDAMEEVRRKGKNAELVLAGPRDEFDGEWMHERTGELGIRDHVKYLGVLESTEVWKNILASDVCVYPFQSDELSYVFPAKIFEYLALGRPVVASRLEGVSKIVKDDLNGLLVDPYDTGQWADAFCRLCDDPQYWQKLADAARESIADFDWSRIHGKIGGAINSVTEKNV